VPLTDPEFGYIGTSSFCRGVITFVICGLVAGGSGIAIFKENLDPDPMTAMALAPAETLSGPARLMRIVEGNSGQGGLEQEAFKRAAVEPRCQSGNTEHLGGDCIAGQINRPRSIRPLNERLPIAAVPIGRLDGPSDMPSTAIQIAVTPETPVESANPADDAPAADIAAAIMEAPVPTVSAQKTRTRGKHVQRRGSRSASYSKHYYQPAYRSGYARVW